MTGGELSIILSAFIENFPFVATKLLCNRVFLGVWQVPSIKVILDK
jgi:hypothetical protein